MKRALLSVAVIVVLAAAALGAWAILGRSSAEAASTPAAKESRFVKLTPLMLPVLGQRRVEQTVGLVLALELEDASKAALVEQNGPKLTDAFITDLYGALEPARLGENGLIDIDQVKARLARAGHRVLGDGVIKEVLVQMVNQRPVRR